MRTREPAIVWVERRGCKARWDPVTRDADVVVRALGWRVRLYAAHAGVPLGSSRVKRGRSAIGGEWAMSVMPRRRSHRIFGLRVRRYETPGRPRS